MDIRLQTQNEKDMPNLNMESKAKMNKWSITPESLALATWQTVMPFTK